MTKRTVEYGVDYYLPSLRAWRLWLALPAIDKARHFAKISRERKYKTRIRLIETIVNERIVK